MKSKQMIVSVSGLIGSGKDTIGAHLVDNYGFTRMSFSSAIKDAVAAIFHWDRELLDGLTSEARVWRETPDPWWTEKLDFGKPMTPRDVVIAFATGLMRDKFHNDIWMLSLQKQITQFDGNVVLTDTRHFNELALVRSMGGHILGVYRKMPSWIATFYTSVEDYVYSETGFLPSEMNVWRKQTHGALTRGGHSSMKEMDLKVHESEWQHLLWTDYDQVLPNTGNLQDLKDKVDLFMHQNWNR